MEHETEDNERAFSKKSSYFQIKKILHVLL